MKVYVPLKEKENSGANMWVAKVGYESNVAFYAISHNMKELYESVNEKAQNHYPGLLELQKSFLNIRRARLGEVDIPENLINSATRKIEETNSREEKIPPSILVPLELELVPVVNFDNDNMDPDFNRFIEARSILSKEEIKYLNKLDAETKLTLTAKDDLLVWECQKGDEKIDYDAFNGKRLISELIKL
ncbi:MAG: hypothetical protein QW279_13645 [Candidatus Jordarchaeaceae archaeon]